MYHKIEDCPRCFTLIGRGFFKKFFLKRDLKKKGHLIFEESKRGRAWVMVVSSRTYSGANLHRKGLPSPP